MKDSFDFQEYFSRSIQNFVSDVIRATLKNPRESLFMARFAASVKAASRKRLEAEKKGEHIPAFLIASITSSCNLHCAGCYSRQNHACSDDEPVGQLSGEDWDRVFTEAEELGVSFILLAGGEPLLRRDVVTAAGNHDSILFPVFTNGFMIGERYLDLFGRSRNLAPIISIEGNESATDGRRGEGVYRRVMESMHSISERGLVFGVSVTVTTENMTEVFSDAFLGGLADLGCKAVIFVEFVPVTDEAKHLAPGDSERAFMQKRISELREKEDRMVYVAFPGDEKNSGGCVAAGRGFFHINSHGGAEPCPFSPYSDINVKDTSLREAIHSRLFEALRTEGVLKEDHAGGCVLFEKREQVERFLAQSLNGWTEKTIMKGKTVREQQSICPCSETCPIGDAVRMIGGRWKMRILCALTLDGTLRYNDLRKRIAGITPAVLSASLKELEQDGLISRTQYEEIPPRVEYAVTEHGKELWPILHSLADWVNRDAPKEERDA